MVVGRPAATCFAGRRGGAAVVEGAGELQWWGARGRGGDGGGVRRGSGRRRRGSGERAGGLAREREELAKGGNLLMAHPEAVRH